MHKKPTGLINWVKFMPFTDVSALKDKIRQLALSRKMLDSGVAANNAAITQPRRDNSREGNRYNNDKNKLDYLENRIRRLETETRTRNSRPTNSNFNKRCYECNSLDHLAYQCPRKRRGYDRRNSVNYPRSFSPRNERNVGRHVRFVNPNRNGNAFPRTNNRSPNHLN